MDILYTEFLGEIVIFVCPSLEKMYWDWGGNILWIFFFIVFCKQFVQEFYKVIEQDKKSFNYVDG